MRVLLDTNVVLDVLLKRDIVCAERYGLDGIVTRDKKGFKDATIPAYTPDELLQEINTDE